MTFSSRGKGKRVRVAISAKARPSAVLSKPTSDGQSQRVPCDAAVAAAGQAGEAPDRIIGDLLEEQRRGRSAPHCPGTRDQNAEHGIADEDQDRAADDEQARRGEGIALHPAAPGETIGREAPHGQRVEQRRPSPGTAIRAATRESRRPRIGRAADGRLRDRSAAIQRRRAAIRSVFCRRKVA